MNSPVSFLTNLRQDRLQRSEMFSWNKIINALKRSRGIIDPFTTFKPSGWKCYKAIGSYVSCAFIEIWSTWEVWRALKKLVLLSATPREILNASFVPSKLSACFISRWTHADVWNNCSVTLVVYKQLFLRTKRYGQNPVFLVPTMLHHKKDFDTYKVLA